ncbi:MAG: hypothetical protein GY754_26135 [bacterium]|nr:hypothetical protein [bacterium]
MIVKEKEALKKTCPITLQSGSRNTCVAQDCMAWEWYNDYEGYCGLIRGDIEYLKRHKEPKEA